MTGSERPPISCCIRTLNEEPRIGAAASAALAVARQVVSDDLAGEISGLFAGGELDANVFRLPDGGRFGTALRVRFALPVFFLRNCLLRGQWRQGRYGFLFALATAYNHWLRYAMLYERRRLDSDGGK